MCLEEASRLRRLAKNPRTVFTYSGHCEKELAKDAIAKIDVENMIRRCRVSMVELDKYGEETWRAEGKDFNGRTIAVVVVAYEMSFEIKVITGWASKGK